MEEKKTGGTPPEKVLLMYQAVVDMVKEGIDINHIKVSDITSRAGIGKGTAYEYFSSKEEIITQALAHDVKEKIQILTEITDGTGTFEDKMHAVLDFIEEKFSENQTFCTLVRIGTGSYEISESFKEEYEKIREGISRGRGEEIMDRIMEQGAKEGIIKQKNIFLRRMAFSAQIIAFAAYLVSRTQGIEIPLTSEEAGQFAYSSIVKSLN